MEKLNVTDNAWIRVRIAIRQFFMYIPFDVVLFLLTFEFPDLFQNFCIFFLSYMSRQFEVIVIPCLDFCFTCAEINIRKLLVVSFYFCRINNFHWQKVFIKWTVYWALILIQSFEDPKILVIYWKTSLYHPANLTYTNLLKKLCKT